MAYLIHCWTEKIPDCWIGEETKNCKYPSCLDNSDSCNLIVGKETLRIARFVGSEVFKISDSWNCLHPELIEKNK